MPDSHLTLWYNPEGGQRNGSKPVPVDMELVHTFEPFTLSQAMIMRPNSYPLLPERVVVKLIDPRFVEPQNGYQPGLNTSGWTSECGGRPNWEGVFSQR